MFSRHCEFVDYIVAIIIIIYILTILLHLAVL
jgi:hypothetical protein